MTVDYDIDKFYAGLVKHGLIIPVGVQGAFGRGSVFEDVLERFNALVTQISKHDNAEIYTFPPVINRQVLEKVHYLDSFPHLCGAVYSFFGKDLQAKALAEKVNTGQPWGDMLGMTDVVLNPAACYPVYPELYRGRARGRAPCHDVELGLSTRTIARTDTHAVIPGS